MNLRDRFWYGYNWRWHTTEPTSLWLRVMRGVHEAFHVHIASRDGSWCFGYRSICRFCIMPYGPWSPEKCKFAAAAINTLPTDQQQQAAARGILSGL